MTTLIWILFIALDVCALAMILIVLMQSVKTTGLGAAFGDSGATDSFFGKNQAKTRDGKLTRITKILAVAIGVICIVLVILLRVR